jgi:hypothetical protein
METAAFESADRRGAVQLYSSLLKQIGCSPTLGAATSLHDAVKHGGNVIITSGFTIMSAKRCETDGVIGAVVIAKILNTIGADILFLTDSEYVTLFESMGRAVGLDSIQCLGFPFQQESAKHEASRILIDFAPVGIIAIERPGWNRRGVYHNMLGEDISNYTAKVDFLFDQAQKKRILTIGIGDGGNEIGMGNILQTVVQSVPFGSVCRCPCKGGIASVTTVDHLVVSSISNWGGYTLAALTASLADIPFEHSESTELRLIKTAVNNGAVDGVSGKMVEAVDGLSATKNADFVERISSILSREK